MTEQKFEYQVSTQPIPLYTTELNQNVRSGGEKEEFCDCTFLTRLIDIHEESIKNFYIIQNYYTMDLL
jgi:hypothetical protein